MIVYKTTNLINNKIYIGQDKYNDDSYYGSGIIITLALNKYGKENFRKDILYESDNKQKINDMEKYYIKHYNSQDKNIGYNIANGGEGGDTLSHHPNKENIFKYRRKPRKIYNIKRSLDSQGKKNPFYKKHHSEDSKRKISESKIGKNPTKEIKDKISKTLKRKYKDGILIQNTSDKEKQRRSTFMKINNPCKNETVRLKISKSLSGSKNPSAKSWLFSNYEGKVYKIIGSFQKFCKEHNLSIKIMRNIADGKRNDKYYNGWTVKKQ